MSPSNKQIINLYIYNWQKEFPQTISNFVLKPKKFQGPIYKYLFYVFRSFSMDPPISWKIIVKTLDFIQRTQISQSGLDLIK